MVSRKTFFVLLPIRVATMYFQITKIGFQMYHFKKPLEHEQNTTKISTFQICFDKIVSWV